MTNKIGFKTFLVKHYTEKDRKKECGKIKDEKKREECMNMKDHEELVDFITAATATNN